MELPYFKFYPKERIADTAHLSFAEKGVYDDLICLLWTKGRACRLPGDDASVARLLGVSVREWAKYRASLVDGQFPVLFIDADGLLYVPWLATAYAAALGKSAQARAAIEARWYPRSEDPDVHGNGTGEDTGEDTDVNTDVSPIVSTTAYASRNTTIVSTNQRESQSQSQSQINKETSERESTRTRSLDVSGFSEAPRRYLVTEKHLAFAHSIGWKGNLRELQVVADNFADNHRKKRTQSADWDGEFRIWMRREVKFYPPTAGTTLPAEAGPTQPAQPKRVIVPATRPNGGTR